MSKSANIIGGENKIITRLTGCGWSTASALLPSILGPFQFRQCLPSVWGVLSLDPNIAFVGQWGQSFSSGWLGDKLQWMKKAEATRNKECSSIFKTISPYLNAPHGLQEFQHNSPWYVVVCFSSFCSFPWSPFSLAWNVLFPAPHSIRISCHWLRNIVQLTFE